MWTDITRAKHARKGQRYPSDMTDAEWAFLEPHFPTRSRLGRPAKWSYRAIMDSLFYLLRGCLAWRTLPKNFPPVSTVQRYSYAWRDSGFWNTINYSLLLSARLAAGREASPSAGVIDSQSVKTTESGGPCGYDAGKKIKGRKRHILTDTLGFFVGALVHTADIQDRDGAPDLLTSIRTSFPWLRHVFADGGYAGEKLATALIGEATGRLKSLSDPTRQKALSSFRAVGSSSAPSHGWAETPPCQGHRGIHLELNSLAIPRLSSTHRKETRKPLISDLIIMSQTLRLTASVITTVL